MSEPQQRTVASVKGEIERKQDEIFKRLGAFLLNLCGGDKDAAWQVISTVDEMLKQEGGEHYAQK